MEEITVRDHLRRQEFTLELNERREVIRAEIIFYEPRPLSEFIRMESLLQSRPSPAARKPIAPRRPCGG